MLVLLPPSETKRDGGDASARLDLAGLGFGSLSPVRRRVIAATRAVSRSVASATAALGLGPTQRAEIERNRSLGNSPVLPAIERYTGVLYDALGADSLSPGARRAAQDHVVVQSALFGLLRAGDRIPAYRLSHDSRLPELPLKKTWRAPIAAELAIRRGLVLDLRSEAYAAMGPLPADEEGRRESLYLRVLSEGPNGERRALNHFNKKGKGEFVRALLDAGIDHDSADSLLEWARGAGLRLSRGRAGELELVV